MLFLVKITSATDSLINQGTANGGEWITHPAFEHHANQWFQFRKVVSIDGAIPNEVNTLIAADSKYWLYINEELVIFEGQLKRGPTPNDTYYDVVNIAPYLKKGNNTIAVLVWYFGRDGFSHKDSGLGGLVIENSLFSTDSSWKISHYRAYQNTEDPQANYRLPESNIRYNAQLAEPEWINQEFDDSEWPLAKSVGEIGVAPWNNLVERSIPQFKRFPLAKSSNFEREGNIITLELPYNMQYHPYIKVKSDAGRLIKISPDNLMTLNDVPLRAEYITREGVQEYLHLPWISGPKAYIEVEEGVEVLEIGYMESGYDTEFVGTFEIDDPILMRYFQKAQRTLYLNMRDTYYDCPDRERAQWIGDGVILMEEAFYLLDDRAVALSRKMFLELFGWQRPDSTLFGPIPAGNWHNELPQQMLAAVGKYGIGRYWLYSGDRELIEIAYPHIKRYLSLWEVQQDGTVPFRPGGWTWGDWGDKIDRELMEHIWVYIALDNLANMAELLGIDDDAQEAREDMSAIKRRLNDLFWSERGYITPGHSEEIDDRGNALAVIAGIATEEKYSTIIQLFKEVEHSSPYMEKYVMEALFEMDEGLFAIERFKRRYANMIEHPHCTTLWEFWDYYASVNHAWSGGPLSVFYKNIAGITPVEVGFEEFNVYPELLGNNSLKCGFNSVRGWISLDITNQEGVVSMRIEVPDSSKANIRIPKESNSVKLPDSSILILEDENYSYYKISSGINLIEYKEE